MTARESYFVCKLYNQMKLTSVKTCISWREPESSLCYDSWFPAEWKWLFFNHWFKKHVVLLCRCLVKLLIWSPKRGRAARKLSYPKRFVLHMCMYMQAWCPSAHSNPVILLLQVSGTGRRCTKTNLAAESNTVVGVYGKTSPSLETRSRISCECHQSSYERRCSASPGLEGQEEKENKLRPDISSLWDQPEPMDCDEFGKNFFPDEDSNQILPVEQFFGNLDAVQVRYCVNLCNNVWQKQASATHDGSIWHDIMRPAGFSSKIVGFYPCPQRVQEATALLRTRRQRWRRGRSQFECWSWELVWSSFCYDLWKDVKPLRAQEKRAKRNATLSPSK